MAKQVTGAARTEGSPAKRRSKLRTPENASRICEMLAEGHTLRQIGRELGCDASAITHWVREDQDAGGAFAQRFARARDAGYERMADDLVEISDADCTVDGKPDNALVQQARLRVDTRKWLLSKMLPRRFGDRITTEVTGDPNAPLLTRIELVAVPPKRPSSLAEDGREYGSDIELSPKPAGLLDKPH